MNHFIWIIQKKGKSKNMGKNKNNPGFSACRNKGMRKGSGVYVCLAGIREVHGITSQDKTKEVGVRLWETLSVLQAEEPDFPLQVMDNHWRLSRGSYV